jgi:hypothetical protein
MGLKSESRKLLKLGRKTARSLGEEGKARVTELYAAAIEALEHALQEARAKKGRKRSNRAASAPEEPSTRSRRTARPGARKTPKKAPARSDTAAASSDNVR